MRLSDIAAILYLAVLLWGVKLAGKAGFFQDCLSKESGNSLRGLFALTVVLHHLSAECYTGTLFKGFSYVGYLSVAVFFFLSGYGLTTRLKEDGQVYIKKLVSRRLPQLIIVYLIFTAIYSAAWLALGYRFNLGYVLGSFVSGAPIVTNSWYIITLVVMYVCFAAVFALCRKKSAMGAAIIAVIQIIYTVLLHQLGYEYHWYMSCLPFSVGIFWSLFKDKIDALLTRRWLWCFLAASVVFAASYVGVGLTASVNITFFGLRLGTRMLSAVAFSLLVATTAAKVKIGNPILRFYGNISLELYLIHGLVYTLLRSKAVYITDDFLWVLLTVAVSTALACGLHKITKRILR